MRHHILAVVLIALIACPISNVVAETYTLVATVTPPGNAPPEQWGGVLRYEFQGTGSLQQVSSIPASMVADPVSATFASNGELFVGNRHGNVGGGLGSVSRFRFDDAGGFTPNGTITGNGLEAVHGLDFNPLGELFAANVLNGTVSRFLFDGEGAPVANGTISTVTDVQGLAFSPWGELFLAADEDTSIKRYVFDDAGNAIWNGSFNVPGAARVLLMGFSPSGELFIPDQSTNLVHRFLFDGAGNPIAHGSISVPKAAALTFSPLGELFVSSSGSGGITRFVFDSQGNAIPNGFLAVSSPIGGLAIIPEPSTALLLGLSGLVVIRRRRVEGSYHH